MVIDGITVGCGGWSKRNTLYGGDQHKDIVDPLLDPKHDAASIRAFFVHPDYARKGVERNIINVCEAAAKASGFKSFELGATLPGVPIYMAMGYESLTHSEVTLSEGEVLALLKMVKSG